MKWTCLILLLYFMGCKANHNGKKVHKDAEEQVKEFEPQFTPGPRVLVYKTKDNYNNLVPVMLSDDGTEIIAYPDPKDLLFSAQSYLPDSLSNGYLLDNRGIGKNVAFLKITYSEYAALENAPSLKEMQEMIVDAEPLSELCDCGNEKAFNDRVAQLNTLIESGKLRSTCKVVK